MAMKPQIGVIGLGKFGYKFGLTLLNLGHHVLEQLVLGGVVAVVDLAADKTGGIIVLAVAGLVGGGPQDTAPHLAAILDLQLFGTVAELLHQTDQGAPDEQLDAPVGVQI